MPNILIVDDQKFERDGVTALIKKFNYDLNISQAENGEKGLECIKNNAVNILFTDIKMPFMDGLELSKKAIEMRPDIKIIIFSGYSEFDYAKKAIALGVIDYILKPINIQEFKYVIEKVINKVLFDEKKVKNNESVNSTLDRANACNCDNNINIDNLNNREIQNVIAYIHDNYSEDICLDSLAEKVYLTPSYLSYVFKKEVGISLIKYITSYRMQKAKELLEKSNMKIVEICKSVGYSNVSYFCQNFKNNYGISPEKYRRKEG
ncbi:response regulator transcription factor [Clostridium oryzae]|uniref:Stage 0 sporulation protein A homolog n=1 Tax=Clostridium oryzae TaxID=1450648 RepID=A0A1V4IKR2_9CLOT|nr:response regulator [Clostridium oryzae]OPJ60414.1 putative response regulatory protein [Clostridium oryzae]